MESQNIEFRAVKQVANAKEIHLRRVGVYGDSILKYSTMAKWSAKYNVGGVP